jgi:hypothetical protein
MPSIRRARDFRGLRAAAERLWYDPARWPSWVDGFGHVARMEGDWPRAGAVLVWDSPPRGRGRVVERVVSHQDAVGQALDVEDERLVGRQRVDFEELEGGVAVTLTLDYRLKRGGSWALMVDWLFVRRALGESLSRTLARFGHELAEDLELHR